MKHILVIDDEPAIRRVLKQIIEREGFNVLLASDGDEGLKLFQQHSPDMVVTDLIMPGKEGIEMIIAIRKQNKAIPIIAMSGGGKNTPESYLHMAGLLGAAELLEKPFTRQDVMAVIHQQLAGM